ncbi:uncharacterized protein [Procambarus clarkii]|uniref:uncharacterized protein isoform X2 n=1 Tax=Procambarus clarkii TaxID=6728 RepID=UPI003743869A
MALVTMVVSALILTQPGVTVATESYGNAFPENSTGAPENTTGAPENSTGALENSTGGPHNQTNSLDAELPELDMFYTISEILVAIIAVIGNALTITVFAVDRKLRRLTNYYIVSLALADLLVGVLGIPFAILTAIGLPQPRWACLLMLSTLLMLCTISIFCLVAVSVDRYWAILHPLRYSRVMTAKIARRIILACWASGTLVGLLPTMGWHEHDDHGLCLFRKVMDYDYLVFLYFCTIVGPGILMAVFYTHIYTVVLKQLRQIAAQEPQADGASLGTQSSQRQRSSFFRSASRGQVSESSSTRYDQRRCSTATNLGQQLPLPRSFKSSNIKNLPQHHNTLHFSSLSHNLEDLQLSPSYHLKLPQSGLHHSYDCDLHQHHPEETLHHYLLRLHFEGALKKSAEELHFDNGDRIDNSAAEESRTLNEERCASFGTSVSCDGNIDRCNSRGASIERCASRGSSTESCTSRNHDLPFLTQGRTPIIVVDAERRLHANGADDLDDSCVRPSWKRLVERMIKRSRRRKEEAEVAMSPTRVGNEEESRRGSTLSHVLHQVTQASRREVKAAKSLSIIVLFFMVSWFPLYTINCVQAFCKQCDVPIFLMSFTIILTHLNSAINPFLYAYHMKDFRNALKAFILHRLLRRPIDPDYGYGRTLVSANYSNIYRVNQAGSTHLPSPQPLLAYNTPPLPDTPLDELRSRSSTIGSYGPLSSNRNLSPSLSFPPSPATVMTIGDGVQELSSCASRPRAATITSHTSPASATIPLISTDESSQPLLSSSVTMNGPRQQPETNGVRRASTLPPLSSQSSDMTATSLNILPHSDRESSCEANINLTTSDTSSASALISETICNGARGDVSDAVIPEATTTTSLQTTSSNCSSLASRHKIDQKENVQSSEPWCGGGDGAARSSMYSSHTCSSTLSSSDTYSGSLAKEALLIPPCKEQLNTSTSNETLLACRAFDGTSISNQSIPICGSNEESVGMVESPELFTQQEGAAQTQIREVALADDHVVLINQTSLPIPNGSACNFSARPVDGDNCTSQSDDNSSGCDASTLPCLGSSTEEQRAKTCREEDPSCRAAAGWTTEQSRVSKELSKYLPKILRRESGLRSKNSRKNKSWWTELMRQRSYHGISLELKSSKHVDRAQSISGAIET